MEKTPESILEAWMSAINNGEIESLLLLYNEDAVLIPTFSNRILQKPETIREYFESLKNRKRLSIALHEKTLVVQHILNDIYSLSGIYCLSSVVDEELIHNEARFSFLVNLSLSRPIMHHHSSQIPR